jgi:dTDP-6-deoxy-L-talose 4-dehydrogenase (NAD+)
MAILQKRILITGATGFVGRQIVKALITDNQKVTIIRRSQNKEKIPSEINIIETEDLFAESDTRLTEILKGTDILIHAAWYAEPGKYLTSPLNLDCLTGTIRLAKAFADVGGKRFVGIGTCFEYDLSQCMLSVNTPLNPKTLYAACKVSAFQVLGQLLTTKNVEFLWCRLFYLYGEGEDPRRLVPYLKKCLSSGEVAELTSGNQIRDFLDIEVAGKMIADAAIATTEGPLNICSGIPITVRQLAEKVADEFGLRDLLKFGARPDNLVDPPCIVGLPQQNVYNTN